MKHVHKRSIDLKYCMYDRNIMYDWKKKCDKMININTHSPWLNYGKY